MTPTKTTITIGLMTIGLLALTFIAAFSKAPRVQVQEASSSQSNERHLARPCSPRTMKGTHGYSYHGTVMGKAIAAAGPITFDGQGSLRATYNVNLGGIPFKGGFTGTYVVNDDCTGTVTLRLPILGISSNGSFVIVNEGKETFFTGTDDGVAITGVTRKQ